MKLLSVFCFGVILIMVSCGEKNDKQKENKVETQIDKSNAPEVIDVPVLIQETIKIKGESGLDITCDVYEVKHGADYAFLFHQAGFSRGEYIETAKIFHDRGINTIAVDLRSGDKVNGVVNETALMAIENKVPNSFLDAEADIKSVISYVEFLHADPLSSFYLVGSSYSASLVLRVGADTLYKHANRIKAVAAFSPGEYLKTRKVKPSIEYMQKPVYITSSKNEISEVKELVSMIDTNLVHQFEPDFDGVHGSKALWSETDNSDKYRASFNKWLDKLK